MCGRFALMSSADLLVSAFGLLDRPTLNPRFNIAPTQRAMVVCHEMGTGRRQFASMKWGLVPSWAKDPSIGQRLINARVETAETKPSFRSAWRKRRCVIPADGFFEWRREGDHKQPYFVHDPNGGPLALAGLWATWTPPDEDGATNTVETFTILTTAANKQMEWLHDRMPILLAPETCGRWIDIGLDPRSLTDGGAADRLVMHPVSRRMNKPDYDVAAAIEPIALKPPATPTDKQNDNPGLFDE